MEIVERILAKLVGQEISVDEMEEINGGRVILPYCGGGTYVTNFDGQSSWTCDS